MTIKLLKNHPSVQLAHLYEHLFSISIKSHMYRLGLFRYVDFSLHCTTFEQGGLIEVDLDLHAPRAKRQGAKIPELPVDLNDNTVGMALLQLLAEEKSPVYIKSLVTAKKALKELAAQPWQSIQELEVFEARTAHLRSGPIYIADGSQPRAQKITTSLALEHNFVLNHGHLLPLFHQVATLIILNTHDQLSIKNGLYFRNLYWQSRTLQANLLSHRTNPIAIDLNRLADDQLKTVKYISKHNGFTRLKDWLQNLSYASDATDAPETNKAYLETGVYIGPKGWQKIATEQNIFLLLKHTNLRMRCGDQTSTARLRA